MSVIGSNILSGASGQGGGYDIEQSVRYENSNSPFLSKTFSGDGNRRTFTISLWFKTTCGGLDTNYLDYAWFYTAYGNDDNQARFQHQTTAYGQFIFQELVSNSATAMIATAGKYRDPAAWYHVVLAIDTTQNDAADRAKIWVNGVEDGVISTAFPQNHQFTYWQQSSTVQSVGRQMASGGGGTAYSRGYFAEYHYIDGSALGPASFGETNADTNQWQAIKYDGSYGTNGFYLKFQDTSAFGDDSSGNNNDFASSGLVATDQVPDTPTNTFCNLNPLDGNGTYSEGNLKVVTSA